jgi:hypothetical protein
MGLRGEVASSCFPCLRRSQNREWKAKGGRIKRQRIVDNHNIQQCGAGAVVKGIKCAVGRG